jgi:hypothetical protein
MDKNGLSELRLAYKRAVKAWIDAIRAEEALATTDHSMSCRAAEIAATLDKFVNLPQDLVNVIVQKF